MLAAGLLSILSSDVSAQGHIEVLGGLNFVGVVAEEVDGDGEQCGLSVFGLESAARVNLDASRIRLRPTSELNPSNRGDFGLFGVSVVVFALRGDLCAGYAEVDVHRWGVVNAGTRAGYVSVFQQSSLFTGGSANFGVRVREWVGQATNEFISAWIQANPKP